MVAPNVIVIKGSKGRYEEFRAAGAITPGHLIKINSDGEVVVHATAGGWGEGIFAIENSLGGTTGGQGNTIATAYADDDLVRAWVAGPGDELYVLVPAAAVAIVKGDQLISNGDGTFKKTTGTPARTFGVALEALDNSGGGSAARIKMRFS